MKLSSLGYALRDALRSLWRNKFMNLASVATVAISLIILGTAWILVVNANYLATKMESELEIIVYIEKETPVEQVQAMKTLLDSVAGVAEAVFISKDEGLKSLEQRFGKETDLLQALGGVNPLPDVYRLKAADANQVPQIAADVEKIAGVEKVRYGQGVVEKLLSLTNWVRSVGLIAIFAVSLASVFLIATSIRLTVFARRREISIMKLVGATNWYIRWPFFLEGMLIGFTGAALAVLSLYFCYSKLTQYIALTISFLPVMTDASVLYGIFRNLLFMGTFLGAVGSAFSLHRFLKI